MTTFELKANVKKLIIKVTRLENEKTIEVSDYSTVMTPIIGGSVEVVNRVLTIPANSFKNNDCLELFAYNYWTFTDNSTSTQLRLYINSSSSLIGATPLSVADSSFYSNPSNVGISNGTISQIMIKNNKLLSFFSDFNWGNTYANYTIDLTKDNYIIVVGSANQLTGTNTLTTTGVTLKKIN